MKLSNVFQGAVLAAAGLLAAGSSAVSPVPPSGAMPAPGTLLQPYQYLPERPGFMSWKTLSQVTLARQNNRMVPQFSPEIMQLDGKTVRMQGFMMPLDIGERQRRFLLTAAPPHCAFCLPAGPEAMIEVRAKEAIRYTIDTVAVSGRIQLLRDDPAGLYYRLVDAEPVRP
ncbi:MAG: DUF3299 domain-containing protein [Casimicrobiaceae bacterium]